MLLALALSRAEVATDLTPTDFDEVVFYSGGRATAFVLFYAREPEEAAAMTRDLEPAWEELGQEYVDNPKVLIATVDCNKW